MAVEILSDTDGTEKYSIPMPVVYDSVLRLTNAVLNAQVTGQENIPEDGALVAPNHSSVLDIPLSAIAIAQLNIPGAKLHRGTHVAKKEIGDKKIIGNLFANTGGTIYIDRDNPSRATIDEGLKILDSDTDPFLIVFLEGTRRNGRPTEIEAGGTIWARRSGKPILPVGIYYPPGFGLLKFRKEIRLHVGEAIPALGQRNKKATGEYNQIVLNGMQKAYDTAENKSKYMKRRPF